MKIVLLHAMDTVENHEKLSIAVYDLYRIRLKNGSSERNETVKIGTLEKGFAVGRIQEKRNKLFTMLSNVRLTFFALSWHWFCCHLFF